MAETKDIVKIRTYNDFIKALQKIEEANLDLVLSFYKYCSKQDDGISFEVAKELIEGELKSIGLKPYKITKEMNLISNIKGVLKQLFLLILME